MCKGQAFEELVMIEVMGWYLKSAKTYRVKWKGDVIRLFRATKKDEKSKVAENIVTKWEKDEEVQEEDLFKDFTKVMATPSYAIIESSKYHQLLVFRYLYLHTSLVPFVLVINYYPVESPKPNNVVIILPVIMLFGQTIRVTPICPVSILRMGTLLNSG